MTTAIQVQPTKKSTDRTGRSDWCVCSWLIIGNSGRITRVAAHSSPVMLVSRLTINVARKSLRSGNDPSEKCRRRTFQRTQGVNVVAVDRRKLRVRQSPNQGAALAGTIRIGDLTVNRLGFGAMHLCGDTVWGRPKDRGRSTRVLHRAVGLGVNFTADSYGRGRPNRPEPHAMTRRGFAAWPSSIGSGPLR